MARRTLDYTVLTAPFDGFIEQRFVENHEEILTGQSIVRLIDPKDIEVNFMLPETSIQLLDIPKKIYVEFDSQKGKLFTTEVKEYIYSSNGSGTVSYTHLHSCVVSRGKCIPNSIHWTYI